MQSNKASKKTNKSAAESPAPVMTTTSPETTAKSRLARSPKSKSESADTSAAKHHHKAVSTTEEAKPATTIAPAAPVAVAEVSVPRAVMTGREVAETGFEPSYDQVAVAAHALWIERGGEHGFAEQDWFRAEQVLKSNKASA